MPFHTRNTINRCTEKMYGKFYGKRSQEPKKRYIGRQREHRLLYHSTQRDRPRVELVGRVSDNRVKSGGLRLQRHDPFTCRHSSLDVEVRHSIEQHFTSVADGPNAACGRDHFLSIWLRNEHFVAEFEWLNAKPE